jgi:predicted enzyme related to lactoylglutathione lyase
MEIMDDFYGGVIGLPRVWHSRVVDGKVENKDLYWAGEAIIENHNCGGRDAPVGAREADPQTARQIQFYRVSELDAIVGRLRARAVTVRGPVPCFHGREAYVLDPMSMLLGLRQSDPDSPLREDVEAARRRRRGEAFNPGCGPMPPGWQELGWVRIRAANLPALRDFYRDTVGMPFLGETDGYARFDLGDNTVLELGGGGAARPPPAMQMSALAAMILRVRDTAAMRRSLQSAGVHFVHELIQTAKGELSYFADPEGNVIGISERTHPGTYVGPLPTALPLVTLEDAEAQRRWVESRASAP